MQNGDSDALEEYAHVSARLAELNSDHALAQTKKCYLVLVLSKMNWNIQLIH